MSMSGMVGETFVQSEVEFRRERAMQQYNRRPSRHHKRHLAWPFGRQPSGPARVNRPAVS
jgi:hypothetical protein